MASEHSSKLWFCRLSLNFAQVLEQLLLSWRAEPDAFNKGKLPESCCSRAQDLIPRPVVFASSIGIQQLRSTAQDA